MSINYNTGAGINGDNLGLSFSIFYKIIGEAILMTAHDKRFHDKMRKCPKIFFFLELSEEFARDSKPNLN